MCLLCMLDSSLYALVFSSVKLDIELIYKSNILVIPVGTQKKQTDIWDVKKKPSSSNVI